MEPINQIKIFKNLDDAERDLVIKETKKIQFNKNEKIFSEGDKGDSLFIIIEGSVRISTIIDGIGEETLAILSCGEIFGEMALIDNKPRSASATANDNCTLLILSKTSFDNLIEIRKDIVVKILKEFIESFSNRFINVCENLKNFNLMDKMFW